jgi:hypothetical protein
MEKYVRVKWTRLIRGNGFFITKETSFIQATNGYSIPLPILFTKGLPGDKYVIELITESEAQNQARVEQCVD